MADSRRRGGWIGGLLGALLVIGLFGEVATVAASPAIPPALSTPAPTPPAVEDDPRGMVAIPDRLAAPVLPDDPTQADFGAQVYYLVCMACHGDAGQGLTPEWLEEWGLGNDSCWQSKCHASNHPPEGFKLPKMIPPVVGAIMPARFADAAALHAYLVERMPWQAPGSLAAEEYWQLTAVLLRMNGRDPGQMTLGPTNAANFRLRPEAAEPLGQRAVGVSPGAALVVGLLVLVGVILIVKSAGRGRRDEI